MDNAALSAIFDARPDVRARVSTAVNEWHDAVDKKIEGIKNNPKIPEDKKAAAIEKVKKAPVPWDDLARKAIDAIREENAPRYTREQMLEAVRQNRLRPEVKTRTEDPRVRSLVEGPETEARRAAAVAKLPAARAAFQAAQSTASNLLTEMSAALGMPHNPQPREILGAENDTAIAISNLRAALGQLTPEQEQAAWDAHKALLDMRNKHNEMAAIEAEADVPVAEQANAYHNWYTPVGGDIGPRTINTYQLPETDPRFPEELTRLPGANAHFRSPGVEREIGHVRRTAQDGEDTGPEWVTILGNEVMREIGPWAEININDHARAGDSWEETLADLREHESFPAGIGAARLSHTTTSTRCKRMAGQ